VGDETIRGWLPPQAPDSEPPGRWDSKLPPAAPRQDGDAERGDADEHGGDPGADLGGGDERTSGIPTGFRREPGR
jgi:hypothetical protein